MRLYHASYIAVENPDIFHSRPYLDFGTGFYLTSMISQAKKYAARFARRGRQAWLSEYELTLNKSDWKIKEFKSYDKEWLQFVSRCRAGLDVEEFDMIVRGIANDKVILTLDRYFNGELSEEQALGELMYHEPNNQYCIRSQNMLDECVKHLQSSRL